MSSAHEYCRYCKHWQPLDHHLEGIVGECQHDGPRIVDSKNQTQFQWTRWNWTCRRHAFIGDSDLERRKACIAEQQDMRWSDRV